MKLHPISQGTVLLSWAASELVSADAPLHHYRHGAPHSLRPRILAHGSAEGLSSDEKDILVYALLGTRERMLGFFLRHETRWFSTDFSVGSLPPVRTISDDTSRGPDRTLGGLAAARTEEVAGFDVGKMIGCPILVTARASVGPWCLLDGYHRCVKILRLHSRQELACDTIPVMIGECRDAENWPWWR